MNVVKGVGILLKDVSAFYVKIWENKNASYNKE